MATQYEIGVIGAGNAAEGIIHGILRNTILFADRVIASNPLEARRRLFTDCFRVDATDDNRRVDHTRQPSATIRVGWVALGGCPPRAPADPYVRD